VGVVPIAQGEPDKDADHEADECCDVDVHGLVSREKKVRSGRLVRPSVVDPPVWPCFATVNDCDGFDFEKKLLAVEAVRNWDVLRLRLQ